MDEGIIRYITAQYSEKLPYGCMIGYVLDNDISFAKKQLHTAIRRRSKLIKLNNQTFLTRTTSSIL
ncbi:MULTISPECIES: hypothetical protein, partial [Microbulbifer]|uniref:hypothetical protein n=1 Tax=Microbulbifer TaxID=48073 RepID=UPI001E4CDFE5